MMINPVRWQWIDYIKGMCMLMVIMSHSNWPYWYARLFIPIFLTGFFFVSGYTFRKKNIKDFMISKIKSLVIPIMCLGFINAILATIADGKPLMERLYGLIIQRSGQWDDLWFVACLFTVEILYYVIASIFKSSALRVLMCIILSICGYYYIKDGGSALPWHFDNACVLILFLGLGVWFREWKYRDMVVSHFRLHGEWMLLAVSVYFVSVLICDNSFVDIHLRQYNIFGEFVACAILGIISLIAISIRLERYSAYIIPKFLNYIGQNTLVYYAFQYKAIRFAWLTLGRYMSSSTYIGNVIYCIMISVILIIPSYIIKRYFPFFIGQKYKLT